MDGCTTSLWPVSSAESRRAAEGIWVGFVDAWSCLVGGLQIRLMIASNVPLGAACWVDVTRGSFRREPTRQVIALARIAW